MPARSFGLVAVGLSLAGSLACGSDSPAPVAPTLPPKPMPALAQVSVWGGPPLEAIGLFRQMQAFARFSDGSQVEVTEQAAWQSSNVSVAIVSATGLLTSTGEGDAEIRAAYMGLVGTWVMTVRRPPRYGPLGPDEVMGRVHESAPRDYIAVHRARVQISGGEHDGRVVTTGIVGEFRIDGFRNTGFDLLVTKTGYLPARYHVARLPDAAAIIAMTPEPGLVSEVFEGNVCTQNPSSTFFRPGQAGLFRVGHKSVALWESSERMSLHANGVEVFPWLYVSEDYQLQAGTGYEFRMSRGAGPCDGSGAFRVTFLRPR